MISTTIKGIQEILRQDTSVAGDAQRLSPDGRVFRQKRGRPSEEGSPRLRRTKEREAFC